MSDETFTQDVFPIKGCLARFLHINWRPANHEQQGLKARKNMVQPSASSATVERLPEHAAFVTASRAGKIDVRPNPDTIVP
jgi:hypothetical protein